VDYENNIGDFGFDYDNLLIKNWECYISCPRI